VREPYFDGIPDVKRLRTASETAQFIN